jgi:hypothetical protein
MLGYDNLMNHFKTNFGLIQHHKYSLAELENMIPWEKAIYVALLANHIKEKEQERREAEIVAQTQSRIKR